MKKPSFINIKCAKARKTYSKSGTDRIKICKMMQQVLDDTGIYNILSRVDFEELIYRICKSNTREQNEDYFLNDIVFKYKLSGQTKSFTEEEIISFFGAYISSERLNLTREEWVFKNNMLLYGINPCSTATLIAKNVSKLLPDEDVLKAQELGKQRIENIKIWKSKKIKYEKLLNCISATNLDKLIEIINTDNPCSAGNAINFIKLQWLYINDLMIYNNENNFYIDQLIDFNTEPWKDADGIFNFFDWQTKYRLNDLNAILEGIEIPIIAFDNLIERALKRYDNSKSSKT